MASDHRGGLAEVGYGLSTPTDWAPKEKRSSGIMMAMEQRPLAGCAAPATADGAAQTPSRERKDRRHLRES